MAEKSSIPWTAFLDPAAQFVTSAGNALYNWLAGGQEQRWQEKAATTAYERQLSLLNNQRAYDHPLAQVQRLIDAGLNPNLAYGQLDLSSSSPVTTPQGGAGSISSPNMHIDASDPLQSQLIQAQIRELRSQADNRDTLMPYQARSLLAQAGLDEKRQDLVLSQTAEVQANIGVLQRTCKKIDAEIGSLNAGTLLKIQEYNYNQLSNPWKIKKLQEEYNLTKSEADNYQKLITATVNELISRKNVNDSQVSLNKAHENVYHKQIELMDKDKSVKDAIINLYVSEKDLNEKNSAYIDAQKKVFEKFGEQLKLSEILRNINDLAGEDYNVATKTRLNSMKQSTVKKMYKSYNWD